MISSTYGVPLKVCTGCSDVKPASEFYACPTRCRECVNTYHREYYRKNPNRQREYYKAKKNDPKSWIVNRLRSKCKQDGTPFDLSVDDIFIPEYCPVLGIKLKLPGQGKHGNESASVDRLEPQKGYVRGNIAIISMLANRLKNNGTASQHERIAAWMRFHNLG